MSSEFGAFIFSFLDDYGLDPYEFRLYARIQRRAGGQGKCYESLESMAKGCLMNIKTARRALQSLVKFNMVGRQDVPGSPTRFWLNPQQLWNDGPTPTKSGGGIDSECDSKDGDIDGPTPTKSGRATKSGRGLDIVECLNLGPTPTKSGRTPLPNQVGEGIPSKVKKLINQETPCIPLLEPAASTPEEETHTERCAGPEEEKAQEEESSQSSSSLVKVQEEAIRESERSTPGQIVPAAGQTNSATKTERKYDSALGMRPNRARVRYLYPDGPWLTANGCIDENFLEWKARDWMKSPAFAGKSLAVVKGNVSSRWTRYGEGPANLEIDWMAYAEEKQTHVGNIKLRLDAGISIPEAEQREIVAAMPAITSTLEPYTERPNTPAILPQEAAQTSSSVQSSFTLSQPALEVKIETSAPDETEQEYRQRMAKIYSQGPAQRVVDQQGQPVANVMPWEAALEEEKLNPPTPEEIAAKQRIAQMLKSGGKKMSRPTEPEKTEFDRLKTLVDFARRDPMTIAQVRAAEWREEIEVDWNEEAEVPYPISIWPNLKF